MVITILYRIIVAIILLLTIWNIFTEEDLLKQFDKSLVIIPLVLRLLMIK